MDTHWNDTERLWEPRAIVSDHVEHLCCSMWLSLHRPQAWISDIQQTYETSIWCMSLSECVRMLLNLLVLVCVWGSMQRLIHNDDRKYSIISAQSVIVTTWGGGRLKMMVRPVWQTAKESGRWSRDGGGDDDWTASSPVISTYIKVFFHQHLLVFICPSLIQPGMIGPRWCLRLGGWALVFSASCFISLKSQIGKTKTTMALFSFYLNDSESTSVIFTF